MTEPLQVGQFAIVDHEPVDRGPNAGVFHGKGPAEDRAELYVVAEGTTPAGESFAGHVVSAIGHTWQSYDISLTGALSQVFRDGARNLSDWNQKSIVQHRVSLGLTCFARRGRQAVIAQAGPSAAFHYSHGELRAYFPDEEHGRPLGTGGPPNPQLTKVELAPGDRLLLISTVALAQIDDEVVGGILGLATDQILPELYHRLKELRHLTVVLVTEPITAAPAMLVAAHSDESDYVIDATAMLGGPARPSPEADGFQASLFVEGKTEAEAAVEVARRRLEEVDAQARIPVLLPTEASEKAPIPLQRAVGDTIMSGLAERQVRPGGHRSSATAAAGPARQIVRPDSNRVSPTPDIEDRRRSRSGSFRRGLIREEPPPPPPPATLDHAPFVEDVARDVRARASSQALPAHLEGGGAAAFGSGPPLVRRRSNMGGRWKGGSGSNRRTAHAAGQVPAWVIIAVGLGLLVLLVGLVTLPGMVKTNEQDQYFSLMERAQQQITAAGVGTDPDARRASLEQAHTLLLQASQSPEATEQVGVLIESVRAAVTQMDAIVNPTAVEVLADLSQFGERPVTVAKLDVGPSNAYLLDPTSNQVLAIGLTSGEVSVVYSENGEAGRARPIAMSQVTGSSGAIIVDADNILWNFTPGEGVRPVVFAVPQGITITDVTADSGYIYVLDAGAAVVHRFQPSADGSFSEAPSEALASPDLANGRRILVWNDEIVVADGDGKLRWFTPQASLLISQAGIDTRLVAAEPPQRFSEAGDVAVMDAPNNRIVIFQRDGTFLRQYRDPQFEGINGFAVGPAGDGYVFSGGKLRRVTW